MTARRRRESEDALLFCVLLFIAVMVACVVTEGVA